MIARALMVLVVLALASCDDRPNQWDAFIYSNDPSNDPLERIEGFKSFELCQKAAISRIKSLPDPSSAYYECGYKCRFEPKYDMSICKETRD